MLNFNKIIKKATALSDKRIALSELSIECPKCGEKEQIQLLNWIIDPVLWKCRTCKNVWEHKK